MCNNHYNLNFSSSKCLHFPKRFHSSSSFFLWILHTSRIFYEQKNRQFKFSRVHRAATSSAMKIHWEFQWEHFFSSSRLIIFLMKIYESNINTATKYAHHDVYISSTSIMIDIMHHKLDFFVCREAVKRERNWRTRREDELNSNSRKPHFSNKKYF